MDGAAPALRLLVVVIMLEGKIAAEMKEIVNHHSLRCTKLRVQLLRQFDSRQNFLSTENLADQIALTQSKYHKSTCFCFLLSAFVFTNPWRCGLWSLVVYKSCANIALCTMKFELKTIMGLFMVCLFHFVLVLCASQTQHWDDAFGVRVWKPICHREQKSNWSCEYHISGQFLNPTKAWPRTKFAASNNSLQDAQYEVFVYSLCFEC